jgi:hypothetical protein
MVRALYKELGQTNTIAKGKGNILRKHLLYIGNIVHKINSGLPADETEVLVAEIMQAETTHNAGFGITVKIHDGWDFAKNAPRSSMDIDGNDL